MNLGLSELTDDQLMDLLQEVLQECSSRDPMIRKVTQGKINDEAAILKERRRLAKEAWNQARAGYLKQLRKELKQAFEQKARSGDILLVTAAEEAEVVNGVARDAISQAKKEFMARIVQDAQNELLSKVLSGEMEVLSPQEKDNLVKDATDTAIVWMKNSGTISLEQFALARRAIYENLIRMGHTKEEVDKLYGKP